MTFSIVAHDPQEHAWGVAVASKFLAVGAVVCWAQAGAGAVATQSFARMSFGPDGLRLMGQGKSAHDTLSSLLAADPQQAQRQVGMVDGQGGAASHTGSECFPWCGHVVGEGFACQGNILVGPQVVYAMADAFRAASGALEDRLLAALLAGDESGGDKRGKQGAALLVVKPGGGYGGDTDRYLDLRVDDDPEPTQRLGGLVKLHRLFFGRPDPADQMPITQDIARQLQGWLVAQGYLKTEVTGEWDEGSKQAFWEMVGSENLEERWNLAGNTDQIDRMALEYLRERFGG